MTELEKDKIKRRIPGLNRLFNKNWNPKNIGAMVARDRISKKTANFILEVYNVMKDVCPDNSDLQVELTPKFGVYQNTYGSNHAREVEIFEGLRIYKIFIIIRFPDTEITNSRKQTVNIKDLFFRIPITPADNYTFPHFDRIQGVRMTVSAEEYAVNYRHSHLPRASWGDRNWDYTEFENFCTGEGDINSNQNLLNAGYDPDLLRLLIMQTEPIARWESLSGTPYIRINEVALKQKEFPDVTQDVCSRLFSRIQNDIRRDKLKPDFNWEYHGGKYRIKDDSKLEDFMLQAAVLGGMSPTLLLCKDEDGEYFLENRINPNSIGVRKTKTLLFQGQEIPLTVYGEIKQSVERKKFIHPTIKHYVKARFEFKANLYQATKVRLGK